MWDPAASQDIQELASPGMLRLPRRGTSRNVAGSHGHSRANSRGIPWEFTRQFPGESLVGTHEIPWHAMGLRSGLALGLRFSRVLTGTSGNSWRFPGKTNRDKLGVMGVSGDQTGTRVTSCDQKRQLAGSHGNPQECTGTRSPM